MSPIQFDFEARWRVLNEEELAFLPGQAGFPYPRAAVSAKL